MTKTGWPPGLLQDDCRKLSNWLANTPGARRIVRENLKEHEMQEELADTKRSARQHTVRLMEVIEDYVSTAVTEGPDGSDALKDAAAERAYAAIKTLLDAKDAEIAALKSDLREYMDAAQAEAQEVNRLNVEIAALRRDAKRLDLLDKATNLDISYAYGDENEGEWRIHKVHGSVNDREWTLVGKGPTVRNALDKAIAQAVQPVKLRAKDAEEAAFEVWLAEKCPFGNVSSVWRQWKNSSEYRDFLAQAVQPS